MYTGTGPNGERPNFKTLPVDYAHYVLFILISSFSFLFLFALWFSRKNNNNNHTPKTWQQQTNKQNKTNRHTKQNNEQNGQAKLKCKFLLAALIFHLHEQRQRTRSLARSWSVLTSQFSFRRSRSQSVVRVFNTTDRHCGRDEEKTVMLKQTKSVQEIWFATVVRLTSSTGESTCNKTLAMYTHGWLQRWRRIQCREGRRGPSSWCWKTPPETPLTTPCWIKNTKHDTKHL